MTLHEFVYLAAFSAGISAVLTFLLARRGAFRKPAPIAPGAFREPDTRAIANRRQAMDSRNVLEPLAIAARNASHLRATGIRLVGDATAFAALNEMAAEGNEDAALIVGNLFNLTTLHDDLPDAEKNAPNRS